MIRNLFSIFDPSMRLFSFSWLSIPICLLFFSSFFWGFSFFYYFFSKLFSFLIFEINYSMSVVNKGVYFWICSLFTLIFSLNFFAIFPYFFSSTSHLLVTFPVSFSFWLAIIFFLWFNFIFNFLSHLIPSGTPFLLISFIVLVELISNIIRPFALTFRLTANIIAGHLLISLIGTMLVNFSFSFIILGRIFQSLLVFIELGVSLIQAYVFITLLVLYRSEIFSH